MLSPSASHCSPPASGFPVTKAGHSWLTWHDLLHLSVLGSSILSWDEQWALCINSSLQRKELPVSRLGLTSRVLTHEAESAGLQPPSIACLYGVGRVQNVLCRWEHDSCLSSPWCKFCQFSDHFYELVLITPTHLGTSPLFSCAFYHRTFFKLVINLFPLLSISVARPNVSLYFWSDIRKNNKSHLLVISTHTHAHTVNRSQMHLAFISLEVTGFGDDLSMITSYK